MRLTEELERTLIAIQVCPGVDLHALVVLPGRHKSNVRRKLRSLRCAGYIEARVSRGGSLRWLRYYATPSALAVLPESILEVAA